MRGIFDAFTTMLFTINVFTRYRFLTAKEVWTAARILLAMEIRFCYLCVNAAVGIGFSCGTDTLARAAGQVEREH